MEYWRLFLSSWERENLGRRYEWYLKFLITKLAEGFMKNFGCSINKLTSVLIRPGSVVRVHNGPLFYLPNLAN
jgi:hypothetical protein